MRSSRWFDGQTVSGLLHRSSLRAGGVAGSASGGPVIGIANSWSELVHCNSHLRELARRVKDGVVRAGGIPVEFPTISLSENLMKPTAMLYRNLMSMDVEESIRSHPLDAVVLLASCDKTTPAQLMGAISADVPAIMLTGGPSEPGYCFGRELGVGTDLWKYTDERRAGTLSDAEYRQLESALIPGHGHCNEMGTASTMATIVEVMGVSLAGSATVPATHHRRGELAEATGMQAVALAHAGVSLRDILDERSLHNAIVALMAIGGSTNAVVHLCAIAGRLGIDLPLERFRAISQQVPVIADVRPVGRLLANDLDRAGGVPSLLAVLEPHLQLDARTVELGTLGDRPRPPTTDPTCIRSLDDPVYPKGAITVVTGNLAPDGAVIKQSAADPDLLSHRGPAIVFDGVEDLMRRIDDPHLGATADSVMVLRGVGPVGAPGMPEWGMVPVPDALLQQGVRDMVRISDARMSGTAFGTIVLHVAPEAAVDGVLRLVRDGDIIDLDVDSGRLHLEVDDDELRRRRAEVGDVVPVRVRGYLGLYREHVMQAPDGADFDFLRGDRAAARDNLPTGLFDGWLSGW
jgi:dihydroxy-acid dehydratase